MVPLRYVFRSRWWALAWAVGICWSAAEFAGSRSATANGGDAADANELSAAAAALN